MKAIALVLSLSLCAIVRATDPAVPVTDAREGRRSPQLYGEWYGRDIVLADLGRSLVMAHSVSGA
jgi:hypothetical protein